MRAHYLIHLIVLSLFFTLPFNVFANELPQVPALLSIPAIPSIEAYGDPKPPDILENAVVIAPDFDFWKEKSLAWPVLGNISSGYGLRSDGDGLVGRMHNGVDIPVPTGTPVQAAADGVVLEARIFTGYGYTVIVDHENGTETLYAHCSELAVKKGERVESGMIIAYAGNTGRASTSHVHFGVMINGAFMDPVVYLKEKQQQFANKR